MALNKIYPASPDLIIKAGKYSEAALARIAHVNEISSQLQAIALEIGTLTPAPYTPVPATLTLATARTAINTLQSETETRLEAIETKLNALINALK